MIDLLVGAGLVLVLRIVFDMLLLAGAATLIYNFHVGTKARFELGDFIAPPGAIHSPAAWFRVKRVDRDKREYLLQTSERTTFLMSFEQAKDQCEVVDANPDHVALWFN